MKRILGVSLAVAAGMMVAPASVLAEDGYNLWLRYPETSTAPSEVAVERSTPIIDAAAAELRR